MVRKNFRVPAEAIEETLRIPAGTAFLEAELSVPAPAAGIVLFAHGSGSSRRSSRNRHVARLLREAGFGTLLMDLLTEEEDEVEGARFDIPRLADRLRAATKWLKESPHVGGLGFAYFGASTGAAVALVAAAEFGPLIRAVVSRGGRPDLAWPALDRVQAPVLLIVGGRDEQVLDLNRKAFDRIRAEKELAVVPEATHLFEEPGALDEVARLAIRWFERYLK